MYTFTIVCISYTCAGRQAHVNASRKYTATNTQTGGGSGTNAIESIDVFDNNIISFMCSFCLNPIFPLLNVTNPFFRDIC